MTLAPVLAAPLAIQMHLVAALITLALTPVLLWRRKGDGRHKLLGRVWMMAMALTALSSFWIMEIRLMGPFSPIHILSLVTLVTLFQAVREARRGNVGAHKANIGGAIAGLTGAGVFTLVPGRLMAESLFPNAQTLGFVAVLGLAILAGCAFYWGRKRKVM